ncbi:YggT family protein [Prochlorococcus sp. MIT 0601]|nr:YggT family protein [Prochlorococcus sp. MIT 0601]
MTWYSQENFKGKIWILFVFPTEPFLKNTRRLIPPIGGVDITPVIWFGIISLIRELLVGQQGIISQIIFNSHSFQ